MAFTLNNNNTLLLLIGLGLLAYYFYFDNTEGFKQRGVSKASRGLSKKGRQPTQIQAAPQILVEAPPVVLVKEAPLPIPVQIVQEPLDDFAGLL